MRSPRLWVVVGPAVAVLGILPIFSGVVRVAVVAAGALVALAAVRAINNRRQYGGSERQHPSPWDAGGGGSGQ